MTRRELEITDRSEIAAILDKGLILHLGLIDNGMPYIVPMNYGYEMDENGKLFIYLHSGTTGYKLDVIRANPNCCFEIETDVTHFEGKLPCMYGTAYSSVIGRGVVAFVEDTQEKITALSKFMKTQTGKDFTFNEGLVSMVAILRIDVTEYTAKRRPLPARVQNQ